MKEIDVHKTITPEDINRALKVLIDNNIEEDEAKTILQAVGYTLLNTELFNEEPDWTELDEGNIQFNKWYDDLIWCPSQCYYYFIQDGVTKCIYLRWRYSDPWTADLIVFNENPSQRDLLDFENCEWVELDVPFFADSQLNELKQTVLKQLEL